MNEINTLFFELLRVAINTQEKLSRLPSESEWCKLYKMAEKQSLIGICFSALQRLGANADDGFVKIGMSEITYFTWLGMAAQIQQRNEQVNRQCVELQERLLADGFRNYIMKGQSNAALYGGLSMLRQPGDIDVYLEGGFEKVLAYAKSVGETKGVNELEMHVKVFEDTEVEFHYRPFIMRNPFKNKQLQKFFKSQKERCFANRLSLPNGGEICAPTMEFNLVHQMVHIYHHLFTEGIGLRQLLDYYFILRNAHANGYTTTKSAQSQSIEEASNMVSNLGLVRFASAMMWVLHEVFGLDVIEIPWTPNQRNGELLLNEIMLSGNFGKTDKRQKGLYNSKWNSFWTVNSKAWRLSRFDRSMWFWGPLWRIYHFVWRKLKGFV